jgi:hypothetical protein
MVEYAAGREASASETISHGECEMAGEARTTTDHKQIKEWV